MPASDRPSAANPARPVSQPGVSAASTLLARGAIAAAGVAGPVSQRLGRAPVDATQVAALFPALSARRCAAIAREIEANRWRGAVVRRLVDRLGPDPLVRLTRVSGEGPLVALREAGRPTVIVAWHAGIGVGVSAGLSRLGLPGLLLREDARPERFGMTHVRPAGGMAARAAAFQKAVRHLRGGGLVALYLDVDPVGPDRGAPFTFFGRRVGMKAGAAAMARLSGAAIVPVAPRWEAGRIHLVCGAPLAPSGGDDHAVTTSLLAWWERTLGDHPGELWPTSVRRMLHGPT